MKKKYNILVTGADGQLGLTFRDISKAYKNSHFHFSNSKELDITKKESIKEALKQCDYDYCINCAAYTNVEGAESQPQKAFKVNAEAVKNLSELCKNHNITLIHISTDYVFDGEKEEPYNINDDTNPINQYGKSKLLGEQYVATNLDKYFIIRTSWLYSKDYGINFYRKILEKARHKTELQVTSSQTGSPTNTVNLAEFVLTLITKNFDEYGILHFCDGVEMTWYDFADKILRENNLKEKISLVKADNYSTFAKRPKYSVLALTKTSLDE